MQVPTPSPINPQLDIFYNDIREYVLANLPYEPTQRAELEAKSAADLLIIYLNWTNRLVRPAPRRVHWSAALRANPIAKARKTDLDKLLDKIEAGETLKPHLSRNVLHGYQPSNIKKSMGGRRDLDLLLAEWQVHHLHISSIVEPDGFVFRPKKGSDEPLLFAAFHSDDAYLIDFFEHGDWTREKIAQILIDDFPQSGFVFHLKNIIGVSHQPSEVERGKRRGYGISSPIIEHNGAFYIIGLGGITSAGTAAMQTKLANYLLATLKKYSEFLTDNPDHIRTMMLANGLNAPDKPDVHFTFVNIHDYALIERTTGTILGWPK